LGKANSRIVLPVAGSSRRLRKKTSRHHEPEIEDLLGCVNLGYKAKNILLLDSSPVGEVDPQVVPTTLLIKKSREGKSGSLSLDFFPEQFRFAESKQAGSKIGCKKNGQGHKAGQHEKEKKQSSGINPLDGF
jgi:hypothetical protein